jgi:hypothetical protein
MAPPASRPGNERWYIEFGASPDYLQLEVIQGIQFASVDLLGSIPLQEEPSGYVTAPGKTDLKETLVAEFSGGREAKKPVH